MFAARREVNSAFTEPSAEFVQRDHLAGHLHIKDALNKVQAIQVEQDMTGEFGIHLGLFGAKIVKSPTEFGEVRVAVDHAVCDQSELAVVGELTAVVRGRLAACGFGVSAEIHIKDGGFERVRVAS